jgi:hypothetical protein
VAGTVNDAFFMYIPIVDNFWQAQASIMIRCASATTRTGHRASL